MLVTIVASIACFIVGGVLSYILFRYALKSKYDNVLKEAETEAEVVSGPWIMKLMNDINFDDYESRMYFDRQLRKSGLFERLEEMGIQDGDTVSIFDFEFEYTK